MAAGLLAISDPVKAEAQAAVRELTAAGIEVWLVTGDARATAEAVAKQVGIPIHNVVAEMLPADKAAIVERLQARGRTVAMVGDGINDAPALAQADLGIAIGTGADVAIEASDVTLIGGDPRGVPAAIGLSRATMTVIRQNLFWAFAYNIVLIPVAMGALYPSSGSRSRPRSPRVRWRSRRCRSSPTRSGCAGTTPVPTPSTESAGEDRWGTCARPGSSARSRSRRSASPAA